MEREQREHRLGRTHREATPRRLRSKGAEYAKNANGQGQKSRSLVTLVKPAYETPPVPMVAPFSPTKHRLIAFEGVDGAGKSTVIREVARALTERGARVFLPRIGKEHSSRPTRMIRRLTRDARNLMLSPTAELLLYCAREAQILRELVRPALARGEIVLLDRSLLTPVVLGAHGRGLPLIECERAAAVASGGLDPDLTFVFDVHPRTSRIRKRLEEVLQRNREPGGRKGLAGSALKERVRQGYLELAASRGYPVFHVERITPDELSRRVLKVLTEGTPPAVLEAPEDAVPSWLFTDDVPLPEALDRVPPRVGLYLSRRLLAARDYRKRLLATEPTLVAWSLDLEDPLRGAVAETEPDYAVRGWARRPLDGPEDLRLRLLGVAPEACLMALQNVRTDAVDALRERYADRAPGAVLWSVMGREDTKAEALRERCWDEGETADRAASLVGCTGREAWKRREKLFESAPVDGLRSLAGLSGERVDSLLAEYAPHAPKVVLSCLLGRADTPAFALRESLFATGREVIDSVRGLDADAAWSLRERAVDLWPSTVAHSLLGLESSPRVQAMRAACESAGRGDLHLQRRLCVLDEYAARPEWAKNAADAEDE
jgi:dTMP kinase